MVFKTDKFEIEFSDNCKEEIDEIYQYISENLVSENSAQKLMRKIRNKINTLSYNPELYEKVHRKNMRSQEFRKIVVDNYIILYSIDKKNKKFIFFICIIIRGIITFNFLNYLII